MNSITPRKLVIDEGSEFKIKVEKLSEFNESFFKDIYDSAAVNVKEIIDNTKEYYEKISNKEFFKDKEEANNIIAFAGERGTGKSSVMVSFAEALKVINIKEYDIYNTKFDDLKGCSFVNLDIIDPALLEDKESIFEIIIAKMFSKFKEFLEKENENMEFEDKKRLLKKFQKVYKDLKIINTDRKDFFKDSAYDEDILQTLVSLASGSNMRNSFIELVDEYLEFFADKKEDEKRFLVIPIDDLDMNIKQSAEMAEEIRKYLMVPNVIILMAVKIDQLKDSVEQMYRENYKIMLEENSLSDDPKEMAERYIEKLIPNGRKLFLPDIRTNKDGSEEEIKLIFKSKKHKKNTTYSSEYSTREEVYRLKHEYIEDEMGSRIVHKKLNNDETNRLGNEEEYIGLSIEDAVLKMTYKKTGLIFIKSKYDVHYLVPDNLRELQNYLIMLNKMEDIDLISKDEHNKVRLENVEKFEIYFLKTWIKRNLSKKYIGIIEQFYSSSIDNKNKFIINSINKMITEELKYKFEEQWENMKQSASFVKDISNNDIFDIKNNSLNVSIGDVLNSLQIYEDLDTPKFKKFKFAIKTIYSLIIYKFIYGQIDKSKELITLVGGNIFGDVGENFIFKRRATLFLSEYNKFEINNNSVVDLVKKIIDYIIAELTNDNNYNEFTEIEVRKYVQVLEWIHYFIYFRAGERGKNYRGDSLPYYEKMSNFGLGNIESKNARFNILAFQFFLLDCDANLEKIFLSYIELKLQNNNDNKYVKNSGKILEAKDIFKKLKEYSMESSIAKWKRAYKTALPIYSMEIIEYIIKNLKKVADKKIKGTIKLSDENDIAYHDNVFKRFFETITLEILEKNIIKENPFLKIKDSDANELCLIIDAYKNCPIISFYFNKDLSDNNNFINTEEGQELIKKIINDIYVKSDIGNYELNSNKTINNLEFIKNYNFNSIINKLIDHRNRFKVWIKRGITVKNLNKLILEILELCNENIISLKFKNDFTEIQNQIDKFNQNVKLTPEDDTVLSLCLKIINAEIDKLVKYRNSGSDS